VYSPDGKYLAATRGLTRSSEDGVSRQPEGATAWILDVSGNEVTRLHHNDSINAIAYSPDGSYVATASDDKTARVWNSHTGQALESFAHNVAVTGVQFSEDGRFLATITDENNALPRVWEVATWKEETVSKKSKFGFDVMNSGGKYLTTISEHGYYERRVRFFDRTVAMNLQFSEAVESRPVNHIVVSQDGKRLAGIWDNYSPPYSEPVDYTIRIVDIPTKKEIAHIKYDGPFENITFTPDDKYFLISGVLDWVHSDLLYETDGAKEVMRLEPEGNISSFAFSRDSKHIVTVVQDGTVRVVDLINRQEVVRIICDGPARAAAFSPYGENVVTASDNGSVQIWQAAGGQHAGRIDGEWREISMSPDGKYLITLKELDFRMWELPAGAETFRKPHSGLNFKLSPNQRYFATDYQNYKTHDYSIHVFETTTGQEIGSISDKKNEKRGKWPWEESFMERAISPDGKYVVAEGTYGEQNPRPIDLPVLVWDTSQDVIALRLAHPGYAGVAAFSADGQYLATAGSSILLWEIPSGRRVAEMLPQQKVEDAEFSPSGKYLITGNANSSPQVWDVSTGSEVKRFEHPDARYPIVFSADERYIASTMTNQTARIWDLRNETELRLVHVGGVQPVSFSADGDFLGTSEITSSDVGARETPHAEIWNVSSGQEVSDFDEQYGSFKAFTPDGRYAITKAYVIAQSTGIIWVMPLKREDLIDMACERLTRNLSLAEWNVYLPSEPYRKTCPQLP